jgi:Glycosyltransferase family 87
MLGIRIVLSPLHAPQKRLAVIASLFGVFGASAWAFYILTLGRQPGVDWMVFYTAARAYLEGQLALLFDGDRFTALLNARFADWLSFPMSFLPWVNPPNFLLLVLPFGLLPFGLSYALFEAGSLAVLIAALARHAEDRASLRLMIFALVLCPATAFTIFLGQSSFLTGALLIAGFGLLGRQPIWAGILFGVLAYKPQFCVLIPVALVAGRHWRTLLAAAATASLSILASAAVFGFGPWRDWLAFAVGASDLYQHWSATARLSGQSVYACLVLLGAAPALAHAAQAVAIALAAACVYRSFRKPLSDGLRLVVVLAASLLAAPHVSSSDGLLAGLAAILYLDARMKNDLRIADAAIVMLVWLSPLATPPQLFAIGRIIPLLLGALIVLAMESGSRTTPGGMPKRGVIAR